MAALQLVTTTPLILAGEVYEKAGAAKAAALNEPARAGWTIGGAPVILAHSHDAPAAGAEAAAGEHDHGDGGWAPADGWQRTLTASLATVLTGIGYALVLMAAMLFAGDEITPRRAVAWAIAAYAAVGLATALGLPPELPGSAAGPLVPRQIWWFATVVATAGGLYALLRVPYLGAKVTGVLLIAAPHIIGAPRAAGYESTAPAELAGRFASTSLVIHAVFWVMIGAAVGLIWQRLAKADSVAAKPMPA